MLKQPITKIVKQKKIKKNSLEVTSMVRIFWNLVFEPNVTLNQHLQKPKIPKRFALKIIRRAVIGVKSIKPEKI